GDGETVEKTPLNGRVMTRASTTVPVPAPMAVSTPAHDETWWAEESARCRSDWKGTIDIHLAVLALLGLVEQEASRRSASHSFATATAALRHLGAAIGSIGERQTARLAAGSTVEALAYSCRRGPSALDRPDNVRRLVELNERQLREVHERVQRFPV